MKKLKCENCGNEKNFYIDCTVAAKMEYDINNPDKEGRIFDVDRNQIDSDFGTVYCRECGEMILED